MVRGCGLAGGGRGIENVASGDLVSIEKITAMEPDLIIGYDYALEGIYEELSKIAPSVGIKLTNGPEWKESFRRTAEVIGREAEYEEWLSGYDEQLEELRSGMRTGGKTVSLLWNGDPSAVHIYASGSQPGTIVEEAGFELSEIAQVEECGPIPGVPSPNVSLEQISKVDADAIPCFCRLRRGLSGLRRNHFGEQNCRVRDG